MEQFRVYLSPLEQERFGVRTARAIGVTASTMPEMMAYCADNAIELLIVRTETSNLDTVHMMEKHGFQLMDTLVYYRRDLQKYPAKRPDFPVPMRPATPTDAAAIEVVARSSFENYFGHYHADPRLDNDLCDEAYIDWAIRSLHDPALAQLMYVAEEPDGEVVGFMTARMNGDEDGEVVLSGVLPKARKRGIYQAFMELGIHWCQEQGAKQIWFITQVTNVVVQKVYVRLNFYLHHSQYTFHKWFDR